MIDDEEYSTKDWYKKIKIEEWNLAIAEYLTEYLKQIVWEENNTPHEAYREIKSFT